MRPSLVLLALLSVVFRPIVGAAGKICSLAVRIQRENSRIQRLQQLGPTWVRRVHESNQDGRVHYFFP